VNNLSQHLRPSRLIHLQTRPAWDPVSQNCIILNTEKHKPSIISTLITDIVLLLIVLIGLLPLLHDRGGSFALGRLLWKQVRSGRSRFTVSQFTYLFPLPKGVIWLLIATVVEVPPTVCPVSLLACFFYPSPCKRRRYSSH
jgi:hypothetical protein